MYNFVFDNPVRVLFGPGQLKHLHEEKLPGKKALIAVSCGTSVKRFGYLDALEDELKQAGVPYAVFDEIRQNPSEENENDGARRMREEGCDFIIALGGGSVMDCAKCIALMAVNEGGIWDYAFSACGGKKTPRHNALPIVCITTSAGTASEVDNGSVISNDRTREKTDVSFPSMMPTLSIVDSDLMMSVPPFFTACQGMDAFFHASETVLNKYHHPMAEMFALKTIELVSKYLPRAVKNGSDREAREMMAYANTFAGYYMMCTSAHSMEHTMGSFHEDLVHGAGLIMIAHAYYGFFAQRHAGEDNLIKMAKAMGVKDPSSGEDFVRALDALTDEIGCGDLSMKDAGITEEEIRLYPGKIHEVLGGDTTADPLPLADADYLAMFESAYKRK